MPPPTIISVFPAINLPQSGGVPLTITGSGFVLGNTTVEFIPFSGGGSASAFGIVQSPTVLNVTMPPLPGPGDWFVYVFTNMGQSNEVEIVVQPGGGGGQGPTVNSISPATGSGGTVVNITGTGFNFVQSVTFAGFAADFDVLSSTFMTATAPNVNILGTVGVVVRTQSGSSPPSQGSNFTYSPPMVVTAFNPTFGPANGGTDVFIFGSGFNSISGVSFSSRTSTQILYVDTSNIEVVSPGASNPDGSYFTGQSQLEVLASGGNQATLAPGFYVYTPFVSGLSQANGLPGTQIAVNGGGMTRVTSVIFSALQQPGGGTPATFFHSGDFSLEVTVPNQPPGVVSAYIQVACQEGLYSPAVPASLFTFENAAPIITAITPTFGSVLGGYPATLFGQGFVGILGVSFGNTGAVLGNVTPTQININSVPSSFFNGIYQTGVVPVSVTTTGGSVSGQDFIYTPVVNGVNPIRGGPGTSVLVIGDGFSRATSVRFGVNGIQATGFSIINDQNIRVVVPTGLSANVPYDLIVTIPEGQSTPNPLDLFTLTGAPSISAIHPSSGPVTLPQGVQILGSGMSGTTGINFVGRPASQINIVSDAEVDCVLPNIGVAGWGYVSVLSTFGPSAPSDSSVFTYLPVITQFLPDVLPLAGNVSVTIQGQGFSQINQILLDNIPISSHINVVSDTQLNFLAPPAPGNQPSIAYVQVCFSGFNNQPACSALGPTLNYGSVLPTIVSVSPPSGPVSGGTVVTVTGTNFSGVFSVLFAGVAGSNVVTLGPTQVQVTTPNLVDAAGAADVQVTTAAGSSPIVPNDQFIFLPIINSITPPSGDPSGGTIINIFGHGFAQVTGVVVGTNNAPPFTIGSPEVLFGPTPPGASGTVPVYVTVVIEGQQYYSIPGPNAVFTYSAPEPTVTSVTPNKVPIDQQVLVTIGGTNFTGVQSIMFAGVPLVSFQVQSPTSIQFLQPVSGVTGFGDITVKSQFGTSPANGRDILYLGPDVIRISPDSGPLSGGNSVTIFGIGFTQASVVNFNNILLPVGTGQGQFQIVSDTEIVVNSVPPGQNVGPVFVSVAVLLNNQLIYSPLTNGLYIYGNPTPTILAIIPNSGPITGGNSVTITGTNFINVTAVEFAGFHAQFTPGNAGFLTAVVPFTGSAGAAEVQVVAATGGASIPNPPIDFYIYTPVVTSIIPNNGPSGQQPTVTIHGAGFTNVSAIEFGTTFLQPGSFFVVNDSTITATGPALPSGPVDVKVGIQFGQIQYFSPLTPNDVFTYGFPVPTVTNLSPNTGSVLGGESIVITGTGFAQVIDVSFGGVSGTGVQVLSPTSMTVRTPRSLVGFCDVTVQTIAGTSFSNPPFDIWTWLPVVTGVQPAFGSPGGGDVLLLYGAGFLFADNVTFDGGPFSRSAPSFFTNSDTQITVVAPSPPNGTGPVDVRVGVIVNGIQQASHRNPPGDVYTYGPPIPTITSISPNGGPFIGGTSVTIFGTNFSGIIAVSFSGIDVPFTVVSPGEITATSPGVPQPGFANILVSNGQGASLPDPTNIFYFLPYITQISPPNGPVTGGTPFTIVGAGFTNVTEVIIDNVQTGPTIISNDTLIQVTSVPSPLPAPGIGQVNVQVGLIINNNLQFSRATPADLFTYVPAVAPNPPSVSGISPNNEASVGSVEVIITGSNFTNATSVHFGSFISPAFQVIGDTEIKALTPNGQVPVGVVDVQVVNAFGFSTSNPPNDLFYFLPAVESVNPGVGPLDGNTVVNITGVGFTNINSVSFSGLQASFEVIDDNHLFAISPPSNVANIVDIQVGINLGGLEFLSLINGGDKFTYFGSQVKITQIIPDTDTVLGGTRILIEGSGFQSGPDISVFFNGSPATDIVVASDSTLFCTDPSNSPGTSPVVVSVSGSQSNSFPFTYTESIGGPALPSIPCVLSRIYDRATAFAQTEPGLASTTPDTALSLCDRVPAGNYIIIRGIGLSVGSYAEQAHAWGMRGVVVTVGDDQVPSNIQQKYPITHQLPQIEYRPSASPDAAYWQVNQSSLAADQIVGPIVTGATAGPQTFRSNKLVVGGHFVVTKTSFNAPAAAGTSIAGIRNLLNLDFVMIDIDYQIWESPGAGQKLLSLLQMYHQRTVRSPAASDAPIISQHYPAFVILPPNTGGFDQLLASDHVLEGLVNGYSGPKTIAAPRIQSNASQRDLVAAWQWARPTDGAGTAMNHCEMVVSLASNAPTIPIPANLSVTFPGLNGSWSVNSGVIFYDDFIAAQLNPSFGPAPTSYWNYNYPSPNASVPGAIVPVIYPDPPPLAQTNRDWALIDTNGSRQQLTVSFENWRTGHIANPNWPTWFTVWDPQCPNGETEPVVNSWIRVNGKPLQLSQSNAPGGGANSSSSIQGHSMVFSGVPVSGNDGIYPILMTVQRSQNNADLLTAFTYVLQVVDPTRVNATSSLVSSTGVPITVPDIAASIVNASNLHSAVPRQVSIYRLPFDWGPATGWCAGSAGPPMLAIPVPPKTYASPYQTGSTCGFTYDPALISTALSDCTPLSICKDQSSALNYSGFVFATAAALSGWNPNAGATIGGFQGIGLFALNPIVGPGQGGSVIGPTNTIQSLLNSQTSLRLAEPALQQAWATTLQTDCIGYSLPQQITHAYLLYTQASGTFPGSGPVPGPICSQTSTGIAPPNVGLVGSAGSCFVGSYGQYNSPLSPPTSGFGNTITICQALQLAYQGGFRDIGSYGFVGATELVTIVAIALAESSGPPALTTSVMNTRAVNHMTCSGGVDCAGNPEPSGVYCEAHGILQIYDYFHPCANNIAPDCGFNPGCAFQYIHDTGASCGSGHCNFGHPADANGSCGLFGTYCGGTQGDGFAIFVPVVQQVLQSCNLTAPVSGGPPPINSNLPPPSIVPAPSGSQLVIGNSALGCPIGYPYITNEATGSTPFSQAILSGSCGWHWLNENLLAVDIASTFGTVIYATCPGTITYRGWDLSNGRCSPNTDCGYGIMVVVHCDSSPNLQPDPVYTRFGHMLMDSLPCSQGGNCGLPQGPVGNSSGDYVSTGTVIGYMDSTGHSFGPHTHYEINVGGLGPQYTICPNGDPVSGIPLDQSPFGPRGGAGPNLLGVCVQDGPLTDQV